MEGVNLFEYVKGSPISRSDPDGLKSVVVRALPWAGGAAAADGPIPIGDIVGAGIITAAAAVDLYLWVKAKDKPVEVDTGDCSKAEHRALQDAVDAACKGASRACTPATKCEDIPKLLGWNRSCLRSRNQINVRCYRGGDPGHIKAADLARDSVMNCISEFERRCRHQQTKRECQK